MRTRICWAFVMLFAVIALAGLAAPEPTPPVKPGPRAAEFERVFGEWKDLLADLGALQVEYRDADEQKRPEIRKRWEQLIRKGEALEPQLVRAAEKAYAEAPNADRRITNLLVDVLIGHVTTRRFQVQTDNYDEALRLGKLLIENKCEDKRVYNAAGIAAFAVGDFEAAEEYLKAAKQNKIEVGSGGEPMDGLINVFLADPARYKEAWQKEKRIRDAEAQADDLPRVLLGTNKGEIELELFENEAPNTVANFISLVEKGYYNGLTFHRVLPGFMAQSGCPKGDGTGGPGYHIPCECYRPNHRRHFRGSLSMAHAGRDTGGSQFFITFMPTSHLDAKHTVFGRVIKGTEVLHRIQRRNPAQPNPPKPDKIIEAKVLRKRPHEYVPRKISANEEG